MELVPIRCKGNDCKKYDDKVWWEDIKTIVQLNNQAVDNLHKCDIKNGDQVLVKFASSKAKKPKLYSVNNLLLNAMYTLSHNYLQEGCINSKFSPGGSSFLVESVTQVSIFYSVLFCAMNGYLLSGKNPLSNMHIYYRILYIDYRTGNTFSTLMTKAQSLQPLYYINVMTEVL